ncbi:MAG: glycolate oxidase subunit GlcF, partial [Burkholderiaceae bacterium]
MQTQLIPVIQETIAGAEAESILRSCVHCGMCNATCPTYQLLGDELDGPRGRIYLIKQMLEGQEVSQTTQTHLDRCLTCRSCETTCPSGVQYHRLLEFGRAEIEQRVSRSWLQKSFRSGLKHGLSNPRLFQLALQLGRRVRGALPSTLRDKIPPQADAALARMPQVQHQRKVLMLAGCVQQSLAPEINAAAARVLDVCSVQSLQVEQAQCCGAVALHLSDAERAKQQARANIDAWWPCIEQGAEAIVMTASGCGLMVHEYAGLLAGDIAYHEKARKVSSLCVDLGQFLYASRSLLI